MSLHALVLSIKPAWQWSWRRIGRRGGPGDQYRPKPLALPHRFPLRPPGGRQGCSCQRRLSERPGRGRASKALHQLCLHEVGQVSRRASEHLSKWACTRPRCLSSQHGSGVGANSEGGVALAISIDRSNWPWPSAFRCDRQVEGRGALASAAFLRGQGEDVHRRALHQLCLHEVGQVSRRANGLARVPCHLSTQHGSGLALIRKERGRGLWSRPLGARLHDGGPCVDSGRAQGCGMSSIFRMSEECPVIPRPRVDFWPRVMRTFVALLRVIPWTLCAIIIDRTNNPSNSLRRQSPKLRAWSGRAPLRHGGSASADYTTWH